ncbi:MAG TPA: DUF998 domain-containing protein [Thermoleophilia bacterium]|nr:DUF998 domain-containing protein [Thermoleophilia bacterium]
MSAFAYLAAVLVVVWAVLVIVAQLLNPEQSPLAMGMSGLARGRAPWVMKSAFVCRGASALVLLFALPSVLGTAALTLTGMAAFWVWGVGSALLALSDTDMPGEPPSRTGSVHALLALVAYLAGVAGAIMLSVVLLRGDDTAGLGVWALPLALTAAAAMAVQFVAFGAAAREAREAREAAALAAAGSGLAEAPAAAPTAAATAAAPAVAPQLPGVPPQLTAGLAAAPGRPSPAGPGDGPAKWLNDLAGYAGLLQRIFIGLLMAWTLLVALGVAGL